MLPKGLPEGERVVRAHSTLLSAAGAARTSQGSRGSVEKLRSRMMDVQLGDKKAGLSDSPKSLPLHGTLSNAVHRQDRQGI